MKKDNNLIFQQHTNKFRREIIHLKSLPNFLKGRVVFVHLVDLPVPHAIVDFVGRILQLEELTGIDVVAVGALRVHRVLGDRGYQQRPGPR